MSELKTRFIDDTYFEYFNTGKHDLAQVYLKSEADETIAELKDENRRLKRALYKALANWALSTLAWLDCIDQGNPAKWSEMHRKCLAKAEKYK